MRLLFLTSLFKPYVTGGAERSVEQLAKALQRIGHEVAIASLSPEGDQVETIEGLPVYRIAHGNPFWTLDADKQSRFQRSWSKWSQAWNTRFAKGLEFVIKEFKPNVINTVSLVDISTEVWKAAARHHVPIVHTICDYDLMCGNSGMFKHGEPCQKWHLNCRLLTLPKRYNQALVDGVTSVGTWILDRHLELGYFRHIPPERRRVIFYSSDVENPGKPVAAGRTDGAPIRFAYLGRISLAKGVGTLVDACVHLHKTRPDLHGRWDCQIGGVAQEPGLAEQLQETARGLPLTFDGWVEPGAYLADADVLIVPSFWPEPSPRTVVEGYRMGLPVIGAASGGIPELIGEAEADWLFEPGNAADLAGKMVRLIEAGRRDLALSDQHRELLEQTRVEQVAANYAAMFAVTIADYQARGSKIEN